MRTYAGQVRVTLPRALHRFANADRFSSIQFFGYGLHGLYVSETMPLRQYLMQMSKLNGTASVHMTQLSSSAMMRKESRSASRTIRLVAFIRAEPSKRKRSKRT